MGESLEPLRDYPATLIQIWHGDLLMWEAIVSEWQHSDWPFGLDREGMKVERTPYRWEGEGTLRRLALTERPRNDVAEATIRAPKERKS